MERRGRYGRGFLTGDKVGELKHRLQRVLHQNPRSVFLVRTIVRALFASAHLIVVFAAEKDFDDFLRSAQPFRMLRHRIILYEPVYQLAKRSRSSVENARAAVVPSCRTDRLRPIRPGSVLLPR